jgi:O-acetyl-ADP-ribose deacetylase (regulator of RNase III)
MSIKTIVGDLLSETTGIIVHGCNAQGAMNSGIAKQIRTKYPQVYRDYILCHQTAGLKLGDIITTQVASDLYVVSGITQEFYGRDPEMVYVNYDAIRSVFKKVRPLAISECLPVKFPTVGGGLGGGHWLTIQGIIEACLCTSVETFLFVQ